MTDTPFSNVTTTGAEAVSGYLRGEGVAHEVLEHDRTLSAAAESEATHSPPEAVAKTVVMHDLGVYMLAVIPASERLDIDKVRDLLGAGESLRLATEAEMARDFPTLEVGAVPPLGPVLPAAEVIDPRLLERNQILCAAGDHTHSLLLDPHDMVAASGAQVADICEA